MSRRVGSLDRPQRYGARSLAVFEKLASGGLFFKLDGRREPVWSNQRWTKLDGTSMRGHVPVDAPPRAAWLGGEGEDGEGGDGSDDGDLAAAIAASLADQGHAAAPAVVPEEPMGEDEPAAGAAAAAAAAAPAEAAAEARTCVVCMSATPDHLVKPCNHLCLCGTCATRVRRERMPCPVCRRPQRGIERIFHA
jgi:hypothetical protein